MDAKVSLGSAAAAILAPKPDRRSRCDERLLVFDSLPVTSMLLLATIRIQRAEGISASSTRAALKDGLYTNLPI
jgi:hypothetical protein